MKHYTSFIPGATKIDTAVPQEEKLVSKRENDKKPQGGGAQ